MFGTPLRARTAHIVCLRVIFFRSHHGAPAGALEHRPCVGNTGVDGYRIRALPAHLTLLKTRKLGKFISVRAHMVSRWKRRARHKIVYIGTPPNSYGMLILRRPV